MRRSPYLLENYREFKSFGFDNWSNKAREGALRDDHSEARHFDHLKQRQLQLRHMQQNETQIFCGFCKTPFDRNVRIECT